jgi:hypothetical protein
MEPAVWLWIPVTIWAAFAQTLRNAAQRSLTDSLGTPGATLVRFLRAAVRALWLWIVNRSATSRCLPTRLRCWS